MDIRKVTIELARPRGNFPGKVETGYYTVADDTVTLVEENGVPVDKYKLSQKLPPNGDPRATACALVRQRYSKNNGDFNRPLQYPTLKY
jgi:hypothetical protein